MPKLLINIKIKEHVVQPNAITNLNNHQKVPLKNPANHKIAMPVNLRPAQTPLHQQQASILPPTITIPTKHPIKIANKTILN